MAENHTTPSLVNYEPVAVGEGQHLPLSAAIELLHALVQRTADQLGIRVLFIKSLAARFHGLRTHTISSDVDALVDSERIGELLAALGDQGWFTRPHDHEADLFPMHSVTLIRPGWPAALDLHYRFPGLDAPSGDVFERLWTRRGRMIVAGLTVNIPAWEDCVVIEAANLLRTPWMGYVPQRLDVLSGAVTRTDRIDDVAVAATETMAGGAISPFLDRVGAKPPPGGWPPPSREWVIATSSRSWAARRLLKISSAPWSEKAHWLKDALWPSEDAVRQQNVYLEVEEVSRYRWLRFVKALRELPSTLARIARLRQGLRQAADHRSAMPKDILRLKPPTASASDLRDQRLLHATRTGSTPITAGSTVSLPLPMAWAAGAEGSSYFVLPALGSTAVWVSGLAATVLEEILEHSPGMSLHSLSERLVAGAPIPVAEAQALLRQALTLLEDAGIITISDRQER